METWNTTFSKKNLLLYLSQGMHIMNGAKIIPKYKRLRNRIIHEHWALEWPMLWRITKNSLSNEGIGNKWVNWAPIFVWYKLLPTTSGPQKLAKISVFKFDNFVLSIFLRQKLKSVVKIEWKKHPYLFFLLLVQK